MAVLTRVVETMRQFAGQIRTCADRMDTNKAIHEIGRHFFA